MPEMYLEGVIIDCEDLEEGDVISNIEILIQRNLNPCELLTVAKHLPFAYLVFYNAEKAHQKTRELFGPYIDGNGHNDCADAFRHSYWNFLNVRSVGRDISKDFGDAHECNTPLDKVLERDMDLFNNERGRLLGLMFGFGMGTPDQFVLNDLMNGNLKVLSPLTSNNSLIPGQSTIISSINCR